MKPSSQPYYPQLASYRLSTKNFQSIKQLATRPVSNSTRQCINQPKSTYSQPLTPPATQPSPCAAEGKQSAWVTKNRRKRSREVKEEDRSLTLCRGVSGRRIVDASEVPSNPEEEEKRWIEG